VFGLNVFEIGLDR